MQKQENEKTQKAKIDKKPEKHQKTKKEEKEQEHTEGKVIYINLMSVVISCVMIFVGIRMLPLKAYQAEEKAGSNDIIYEANKEEIEYIEKENIDQENINQETEEIESVEADSSIDDVSEKQENIEIQNTYQEKYYIQNVPFINQLKLGYPMGCEAVSATMAAKYAGYNVEVEEIVANTPTDIEGKRKETITKQVETTDEETGERVITIEEEEVWIGENPFEYFVGDPRKEKTQGAYGCFAGPIVTALQKCGISCTNISRGEIDVLYDYIRQGKPVIVWCRANANDLVEGVTWKYPDRKWRIC